jgi:hypothetical protein
MIRDTPPEADLERSGAETATEAGTEASIGALAAVAQGAPIAIRQSCAPKDRLMFSRRHSNEDEASA